MMGDQVGAFLAACRTPSAARDIIRAVFAGEISDLEPFYALKNHCIDRGLISSERTMEGLLRYRLTERGHESLRTYEMLAGDSMSRQENLSLVNY